MTRKKYQAPITSYIAVSTLNYPIPLRSQHSQKIHALKTKLTMNYANEITQVKRLIKMNRSLKHKKPCKTYKKIGMSYSNGKDTRYAGVEG